MSDITNLSTLSPDQQADIYFLAGINATGTVVATSFQTWARDTPPTYTQTFANWGIWNNDANGVAQPTEAGYYRTVGSYGGTVTYAFDPAADFTTTQQTAIIAGLTLWSDEVGINFKQVSNATTADLLFESNDGNGGGGFAESPDDGNTVGDTDVAINLTPTVPNGGQAVISLGVGDAFGAFGSFASGGDSYSAMIHEIGHLLGLGHAGPYGDGEPDQDPEASQFNEFDSDQWSIMSYLTPYDTAATYYSQYTVKGTNWSYANATTPQMDDILAAQLLYGQSTSSTFGGGQTFGFHCNITDAAEPFFDFTINTAPVITIYDTGIGNTLDLSGYSMACTVNLNPGSFSSVGGLTNNVGIAYGTRIDSAIGGAGNDSFVVNADPDTIDGGGGKNTVIFGGDEASYVIADPEPGLVTVTSGSIVDDLTNIQYLQFADATLLTGTADIGTVFSWTLAAGGSFDSAESWRPTAVPSTLDTAQFLIPNSFTVSGNGMPGYLLVDDDVTFTGSIEAVGLAGQSNAFEVGDTVGAFGSVSLVSGATLDIDKYSLIGADGDGTVSFVNGASGTFDGFDIADAGPANSLVADSGLVMVDGVGTAVTLVGGGNVGNYGNGTLAISDGASFQLLAAPVMNYSHLDLGVYAGSSGTVTVTNGATLDLGFDLGVGGSGTGLVSFTDGATGTLTGLQYGGSYGPAEAAYLGGSGGSGTLSLDGSLTTVTANAGLGVGEYSGGTGLVILTNGAELAIEPSATADTTVITGVGGSAGSFGTVDVFSHAQIAGTGDWFIGGGNGYGSIDITTGGTVDSYDALFGEFSGAVGVGVIDDGLWDALNSMAVGAFGGSGTLTVQDSGTLAVGSGGLSLAGYPGATGLLIVNGGTVNVAGANLSTGAGSATIIAESNGVINVTGAITIGGSGSAYAAITNSGSLLDFGSDITIANLGTLALDASAVINTALTLNGGTLNALGSLDVPVAVEIAGGTTADPSALVGVAGSDLLVSHGVTFESGANAVLLLGRAFDTSTTLYNVAAGDTLDIAGQVFNTASYDTATSQLILSENNDPLTLNIANNGYSADSFSAYSDNNGGTDVSLGPPPCYVAGTLIATPAGERPVESLRAGDRVLLAAGGTAPVVWVGHRRVDPARHPRPCEIYPIRIQAGAIAHDLPRRDLLVSPDHALLLDGVLIEARRLVNGATIRQDDVPGSVHYLHIELPRHDVLLAEGVAAESFLDTGNRTAFSNGGAPAALHPSFATARPAAEAAVAWAIWRRLTARALTLGYALPPAAALSADPDLAVLAGTRRLKPTHTAGPSVLFALPPGLRVLRLRSRAGVPADAAPWLDDRRSLGVAVRRIRLRGAADCHDVALDGPALGGGWWAPEGPRDRLWRWTDGDAELRLGPDCSTLELELHGAHAYPVEAAAHLFTAATSSRATR
jgi:T5SS/PEP-CTERM-associated repeat protein